MLQRDQEINRLKAIVEKLSENQLKEVKTSLKESRSKDVVNHQTEEIQLRLVELELNFEKQKTENERLRLEMKEVELEQELIKNKLKEEYELRITSLQQDKDAREKMEEVVQWNQREEEARINVDIEEKELNEAKGEAQSEMASRLSNKNDVKRFQRRSDRFDRDTLSPTARISPNPSTPSKVTQRYEGWKDLLPEYFGKKKKK